MKLENFCCTYAPGTECLSGGGCARTVVPSLGKAKQLQLLPARLEASGIDREKLEKLRITLNFTCKGL